MKYLGFPLPELEIIYPICAKGCQKIRDAEFLEDIRYTMLLSTVIQYVYTACICACVRMQRKKFPCIYLLNFVKIIS